MIESLKNLNCKELQRNTEGGTRCQTLW